ETRRLLCDTKVIPAVLDALGVVLDVGRARRTVPKALRGALILRDRGCAFPGCDRPPAWCDAHHIQFWARDLGVTSLDNGVLLCGHHHRLIHQQDWTIQLNPEDRLPEFIPPPWLDPGQRPRRNTHHPPHHPAASSG
ncbi:HNH endonuclease signature motif containing protein, partial [Nakamurella alba]|uniref:HNH endonuclease signature motif containing protein n=1 Tax=Nakamurella alba TaxID=2665158 RepID=UPI0018A8BE63